MTSSTIGYKTLSIGYERLSKKKKKFVCIYESTFFKKYTGNHLHKLLQNIEMVKDGLLNDISEINERFERNEKE